MRIQLRPSSTSNTIGMMLNDTACTQMTTCRSCSRIPPAPPVTGHMYSVAFSLLRRTPPAPPLTCSPVPVVPQIPPPSRRNEGLRVRHLPTKVHPQRPSQFLLTPWRTWHSWMNVPYHRWITYIF